MRLGVKKKAGGSRFWVRKKGEGLWVRKKGLWVRKEGLWVRKEGLWVRKEGLGVRKEGLWVRKEGLWVRKEGLWVRKEGLWVRKEGLWVRKKGCGSEKKGCGSEKKESRFALQLQSIGMCLGSFSDLSGGRPPPLFQGIHGTTSFKDNSPDMTFKGALSECFAKQCIHACQLVASVS